MAQARLSHGPGTLELWHTQAQARLIHGPGTLKLWHSLAQARLIHELTQIQKFNRQPQTSAGAREYK